jgi:citrate synthase
MPLDPDPELSHAGNFLYMATGHKPTKVEERVMDTALILHADHGMNASTFACLVVASTLSDIYWSVGSGIAALSGPLHGGANEEVLHTLKVIGGPAKVEAWLADALERKEKIMGFGHRVYKAPDPRARILGPLAKALAHRKDDEDIQALVATAEELERQVVAKLGAKKIFPNVDFYSGLVYAALDIPPEHFTPIFAVSRVSGWCARVLEYLQNNRIFRPRATYVGSVNKQYRPLDERGRRRRGKKS